MAFSLVLIQVCGQALLYITTRLTVVQGSPVTVNDISYTALRIDRMQGEIDCEPWKFTIMKNTQSVVYIRYY
jgi:hypothetical protein